MALQPDPFWYKDAVIYQVHVKSFFDSNDDGVGDLPGLTAKLDYIASLGVSAIWLLPFYPSPRRDDGYDIADYRGVHPEYGNLKDFRRLIAAAHERNLRVITELVVNHTSDQHPWFQRARRAKPGSPHRDFYVWRDDDKGYAETRIIFLDTEKSNWAWDELAQAYYWHRFYSHQPDLNFENPRVMKELLAALDFWLELGVDGLRLDAVPYLCEREGTINENLPETHGKIREIRAALDRRYADKMLLAEANQWPEDVKEYFGNGDECHMAFHFPLMPRMYMAVAQEDRYPITDILRQTPPIPEACQWAIFLRNHDELTLEMVTDAERDYLWNVYANDPRARLNLGIRRRLAPLMDHDRRRIELMTSLLLSMPGTPVIYYGDEIGMGDNIFLGDRDGVRTPMQWSPDRNGGFSKADPARLVLPPIMDAVYGYDAVNVEAQSRDPHSLLNWTRRMVQIRQSRRTFGRGELRFLYPGNRKVLAYIRLFENEAILCVNNLARTAQSVELDLAAYNGRVPIELMGRTAFPPVGELPYLVTLPPYGFFWFLLAVDAEVPAWHVPSPTPMPEYVTFVLRDGWRLLLEGDSLQILEGGVLPTYLQLRRWYGAKGVHQRRIPVTRATEFGSGENSALFLELLGEADRDDRYFLPVTVAWDDRPQVGAAGVQLALARARRGRRVGYLTDATSQDGFVRQLLQTLREGAVISDADGSAVHFRPASRLAEIPFAIDQEIHRPSAEQSNTSVMVDSKLVLKFIRRTFPGQHPDAEMSRYLSEVMRFEAIPPFLGEIVRVETDGSERLLCVAQAFIRNQGDGWVWLHEQLRRVLIDTLFESDVAGLAGHEAVRPSRLFVQSLGRRVGEMHAALAQPTDNPDFQPEPISAADSAQCRLQVEREARAALAMLEERKASLQESALPLAEALLEREEHLLAGIAAAAADIRQGLKIRVHGDLHLGQVLVVAGDAVIVDFEGEPSRSLAERRAKWSPARDVAGMIRSFDYAARAAVSESAAAKPVDVDTELRLAKAWRKQMTDDFLAAYFGAIGADPCWPADMTARARLIDFFLRWKAVYELAYELGNRPHWAHLPLRALLELSAPMEVAR